MDSSPVRTIILLGNRSVGKTCLFQRITHSTEYPFSPDPTEFTTHSLFFHQKTPYYLCDTPGVLSDELGTFISKSSVVLIVYDTTLSDGLSMIPQWFRLARKYGNSPVILLGTKYSDSESYQFPYYLSHLSHTYHIQHRKVNSITNQHIEEVLQLIHETKQDTIPTMEEESLCRCS